MRIRGLTEDDNFNITAMISRDPDHTAKGMTAEFFYPQPVLGFPPPEQICICFEDKIGPVFYARLDVEPPTTIRLHVQFDSSPLEARRTAFMLKWGFKELVRKYIHGSAAKRIIFESTAPSLREFCMSPALGFRPLAGTNDLEYLMEAPVED